jgi:large subunit ribosomal protein L3
MTTTSQPNAAATVKGLLGTKLGMTQVWDEAGRLVPVTAVKVDTNVVTQVRSVERDGYTAVQLAYGAIDPRKVTQPLRKRFDAAGITPRRHVTEIRTADAGEYSVGQELTGETFEIGERVDVVGTSKGKGFAGVMKRHGFAGVSASHGAHRNHRMGVARRTVQNLTVHSVDLDNGVLLIAGAVPGPKGGLVVVRTAAKGA